MKHITSAIITVIALAGALHAERGFFVFDNGLNDIKSAGEQAALLQELGYDGICTRPQKANEEFLTAMDRHGIKIIATYVSIPIQGDGRSIPRDIEDHIRELKKRGTTVWLTISNEDAGDEATLSTIRRVCDVAAESGLEVFLYPLGLAAIKVGKALEWEPLAEKITNHPEAAAHMTGSYREPWDLKKLVSLSD
jgi:sugar phosphate isomerase/epimerase